jgi:hypothetical protein
MRTHISPFRHVFESVLNLVGRGPRRSRFTPARDPESRLRFARYVSRVQPEPDPTALRRSTRLLGQGGSMSRGDVRHAPLSEFPVGGESGRFRVHLFGQPGGVAARRRAQSQRSVFSLRTLIHALRVR